VRINEVEQAAFQRATAGLLQSELTEPGQRALYNAIEAAA
jgi:hypothetical protein